MRLALVGTRGIPAAYSGFETAVENIGARLADRGHDVVVYCRPHAVRERLGTYRGMRLVHLPTIQTKHLDTFAHTLLSTAHLVTVERPDVALYFIVGNSPFTRLARLAGIPAIINVDGLDSLRAKWSPPAKAYLRWAERNAARFADVVITDSTAVQEIYRRDYHAETEFIPYGADMDGDDSGELLGALGLEPRGYILFVGRLEPENNAHVLVEAFAGLHTDMRLVVVGDAPYAGRYAQVLRKLAASDPRVLLAGPIYGEGYRELARHAALFVVPSEVGGTHPVIVEAMMAGNCVVVNDHLPNLEVVGDAAVGYEGRLGAPALTPVLQDLLDHPDDIERYRVAAARRARTIYSWEAVTDAYERLAQDLMQRRPEGPPSERSTRSRA